MTGQDVAVPMASVLDGTTHLISLDHPDNACHCAYLALCGQTIVAGSLAGPPGPTCLQCQRVAVGEQATEPAYQATARPAPAVVNSVVECGCDISVEIAASTDHYFEIQARVVEHRDGAVVRDEVRRDRAESLHDALRAAHAFYVDGFTVWIYRVERGPETATVYNAVGTLPAPSRRRGRKPPARNR